MVDLSTVCIIRLACESDVPGMVALLTQLFAIESDFQADPDKQDSGLRLLLQHSRARVWVAEEEGAIVGLCTLQVLISTAEGGEVGLIEDLVVAERRRGQGIGCRLLEAAEAWSAENRLSRLQLLADRDNQPALSFYQRQGWGTTRLMALRKMQ